MSLVSNFDKADEGYSRSSKGLAAHPTDIMNRTPSPNMESLFNVSASQVHEEPKTFTESLIKGNTRTETLTEIMRPDTSYAPPKIDAKSKMRSADKVITDGKEVTRQLSSAKENTKEQIANFQKDWKQAKHECLDALKCSAEDMNINPVDAVDALVPDSSPSKGAAVAYVVGASVNGYLGAAVTMFNGISDADKKLTVEQQEALLEDTMKRLEAPVVSMDTRDNPSAGSSVPMDAPKKSDVAWENMATDDLAEFLAADPDGLDQPEMEALLQMEHDVDFAIENNEATAYNYGNTNVMEKSVALASTGQSNVAERELNSAIVLVDAPAVDLAGQSLNGIVKIDVGNKMAANDVVFANVADVSTKIDETKVDYTILANELKGYAMDQFNIG